MIKERIEFKVNYYYYYYYYYYYIKRERERERERIIMYKIMKHKKLI